MATVTAKYLGDLRVECTHVASGTKLVSDAPVDNNGKGEAFSPTDLCVTALASCAMTIIGIYGKMHNVDVVGTEIEVAKTMSANPRRIGKIEVTFIMPDREYTDKQKTMIERAAHTCPVHLSLHPGQIGMVPATGELVSNDVKEQAAQALANMKAVLAEAGATPADVTKVTVFIVDMADFQAVNSVYSETFGADAPARSCVAVAALPKGARVEIEAIAVL